MPSPSKGPWRATRLFDDGEVVVVSFGSLLASRWSDTAKPAQVEGMYGHIRGLSDAVGGKISMLNVIDAIDPTLGGFESRNTSANILRDLGELIVAQAYVMLGPEVVLGDHKGTVHSVNQISRTTIPTGVFHNLAAGCAWLDAMPGVRTRGYPRIPVGDIARELELRGA